MPYQKRRSRMSGHSMVTSGMSKRELTKNYKLLVRSLLTDAEKEFMYRSAKRYQRKRYIDVFCQELGQIINTHGKLRLLPYIRTIVSDYDRHEYDKFVRRLENNMYEGRTEFPSKHRETYSTVPSVRSSIPHGRDDLRVIVIPHRDENSGFSIRGGSEHGLGIYVSEVDEGSTAADAGLEVGDQILEANNISLESAACSSAVRVLTVTDRLKLFIKRVGKIPEWKLAKEKVLWYDVDSGNIIAALPDDPDKYHISGLDRQGTREKRVAIQTSLNTDFLGFNIRGGSEYGLGIYISRVDTGGLAEKNGVCTGDQILDVNGTDFTHISHNIAADYLRTNSNLVLTLKEVGRYPAYKELFAEYTWSEKNNRMPAHIPLAESPISSRQSSFHREYVPHTNRARSLSNFSGSSGVQGILQADIYLPQDSQREDIIIHEEREPYKIVDVYEFNEMNSGGNKMDRRDELDFNDAHFVRLNGNDDNVNDTDSGKLKKHHEKKKFPNTSKVMYNNNLTKHYETREVIYEKEPKPEPYIEMSHYEIRETIPNATTHTTRSNIYETVDVNHESKPMNFEEYIIPKDKLPVYSTPPVSVESEAITRSEMSNVHSQPTRDLDTQTIDTVIVTEVDLEEDKPKREPIYAKVNKTKVRKQRTQREATDNKEETTDGSMTPEEEVMENFDHQIKMLEDRKSHLSTRAVAQINTKENGEQISENSENKLKQAPLSVPVNHGNVDKDKVRQVEEAAREMLDTPDSSEVIQLIEAYHENKDLDLLVKSLLKVLDKPEKMLLLKDIRGVIYPYHVARFDNLVNFYEIDRYDDMSIKLHLPLRHQEKVQEKPKKKLMTTVLDENGHFHIRTVDQHEKDVKNKTTVLQRMKSQTSQDFAKEQPKSVSTGLSLIGGRVSRVNLPIRIDEVQPESAADLDGKIQPGMILLSVNGKSLVGVTLKDARSVLDRAFRNPSLELKLELKKSKAMCSL